MTKSALVIGGGIAGISAAARLSDHIQVTVLEQEAHLAYHASGRSAALFEPNYGNTAVKALNRASAEYHQPYLTPRGFLLLGIARENDLFEKDLHDLGGSEISPQEAQAMVPILNTDHITRASFHDAAQDIDTDRMVQDFAKHVRANNGKVLTGQSVTSIVHHDNLWHVTTETDTFHADLLINAAGPWVDEIAQLAGLDPIGITPLRRSMARITAPGGHDVSKWPMFFGAGETWYAKPDAGALIVSPAEEDPVAPMDAWPEDMILAEGLARYQDFVTKDVTRPLSTWAGLRSFAPDRSLVLGQDPDMPTFIWCAGQGGYGFQTAPAASQLVADLALGRPPELRAEEIATFDPGRFR
ncbi:MAG: FAD-binding oxidoreductase [Aliishimia sp.]